MAIDPICKMEVDEEKTKFKLEYKNRIYYFCSKECLSALKENPERYLKGE